MKRNTDSVLREKFLQITPEGEMGCWRHYGALANGGYGQVRYQTRLTVAHRVSYLVFRGDVEEGLDLDHLCRNRWCVNPWHLEPVTRSENIRRGIRWA